jgi:hypothetical protein
MALHASGLDQDVSGLVVQVGYSNTTVLPVCSRHALVHAATVAKLGSRNLHLCLRALILEVWLSYVHGCVVCDTRLLACTRSALLSLTSRPCIALTELLVWRWLLLRMCRAKTSSGQTSLHGQERMGAVLVGGVATKTMPPPTIHYLPPTCTLVHTLCSTWMWMS